MQIYPKSFLNVFSLYEGFYCTIYNCTISEWVILQKSFTKWYWQRVSFLSVIFCLFVPLLSRLVQKLALFDQRQEDKAFMVKKETVWISDDYSLLSQTLHDHQFTSIWSWRRISEIKLISNDNRTEWRPIQSVIIQVINKIDLLIKRTIIIDRIGQHEILLAVNQHCSFRGSFWICSKISVFETWRCYQWSLSGSFKCSFNCNWFI